MDRFLHARRASKIRSYSRIKKNRDHWGPHIKKEKRVRKKVTVFTTWKGSMVCVRKILGLTATGKEKKGSLGHERMEFQEGDIEKRP